MNGCGVWAAYENKTSHLESEGFMGMLFHVISKKKKNYILLISKRRCTKQRALQEDYTRQRGDSG